MKVAISHAHWGLSAQRLKEWLEANGHTVFIYEKPRYTRGTFDVFLNIGWGLNVDTNAKHRIGNYRSIAKCVNKLTTFQILEKAGIQIPKYVFMKRHIPKTWDEIVCRKTLVGRKNEGIEFHRHIHDVPEGCELYVQGVPTNYEWRIVVFKGEVVGRYHKHLQDNTWTLNKRGPAGFEQMDKDAIKAAKALGADYVGFDIVGKNKKNYWFLEANSAATLNEEVAEKIVEYINSL